MPLPAAAALAMKLIIPSVLGSMQGNTAGVPSMSPKQGIDMEPTKMNLETANANLPEGVSPLPDKIEKIPTPDITAVPEKLAVPEAGMGTEEKMAMAAQLGSLLRGPGAPPPPGRGGQGINMAPVFQNITMRQLAGR